MILTRKQEEGLKIAVSRYEAGEKYVVISGYAGTGKSTLVRFIIDALDVSKDKVAYATYTGKAAEVLRKKGNKNAMTLHKLLYESHPRKEGGFYHKPKPSLEYTIVVVDEVSMAPRSMIDMLLKHNVYVIFLGDPFQLPQIDKNESHDLLDHPHIFLDQVMRQASESEIIQLTMKIRNHEPIDNKKGNEVIILPRKGLVTGHFTWADQIICATNATKSAINQKMRTMLGFSGLPQDGEKMICLRNYWDDLSTDGETALVNGMTGIIRNPFTTFVMAPRYLKLDRYRFNIIMGEFEAEDGSCFSSVNMDQQMIETGEKCIDWRDFYTLNSLKHRIGDIIPREFAYGYAITGHKAQGSEWDKVLVIEESFPYDKEEHARWLYTACTRASKKLVLII